MRFAIQVVTLVSVFSLIGCASGTPSGVIEPRLVAGTLIVPHMEASTMSQTSAVVRITVTNDDVKDIVVKSLQVESIGVGPYVVARSDRKFNSSIAPGRSETFEVFTNARAMTTDDRPAGQEGNLQLRVLGYFGSWAGDFKKMEIQSIGTAYASPSEATRPKD